MRPDSCLVLLLAGFWCASVVARNIHYGAVTEPVLLECDAMQWSGRRAAADLCYSNLLQRSANPLARAEAAWALGDLKTANNWFQEAASLQPDSAAVRQRWGDLYADTYQYQEAMELYTEALERDPENAFASVGAARVLSQSYLSAGEKYLEQVLTKPEAPAGARLQAKLLQAWMALESSNRKHASEILDEPTQLAAGTGLPRLEIHALRAALDLLGGMKHSAWIDKALAENPAYGDIYATPGHFAWITHRYRDAVKLYEQAITVQPELWSAHLELGVNLLRDNRITRARRHLETAYAGDPYNPKAVNTLRLLDTLDDFVLETVPELPAAGHPQLQLRMHRDESAVLGTYVRQLAQDGIKQFSRRYRYQPQEPVVIELYPNHEDFVVRTIGMPGLGILGATFGYVFAMDSPTAHAGDEYHWGTTFWHELAHVFTLEASEHKVPRWFSEGISVFEEWRTGPIKGIRIPVEVFRAIADGKLLPVADLNQGFIRPAYEGQVQVSYIQAGLICEFIDRTYGFEKLVDLLYQFDFNTTTGQAIVNTLAIPATEFDRQFQAFLDREYGGFIFKLDLWHKAKQTALQAMQDSDWDNAITSARKAIEIYPDYVESDSPYITLAEALAATGEPQGELEALRTFWEKGGFVPEVVQRLAMKLEDSGERETAIRVMQSLNLVIPFNEQVHALLGDWLLQQGRAGEALTEFEVMLALDPHDRAAAHFRLAGAWHALRNIPETRRQLLKALDIAPHYRPAQKLLLEIARLESD
jgi:tetratricopeptide (TPR) repeat protein